VITCDDDYDAYDDDDDDDCLVAVALSTLQVGFWKQSSHAGA
jgi:hypothetical protein